MTRDEVIRMAWDAGVWIPMGCEREKCVDTLQRFASLIAAAGREECERALDELRGSVSMFATSKEARAHNNAVTCCVEAIRARGES